MVGCCNRFPVGQRERVVDNCKAVGLVKWKEGVVTKLTKTFRGSSMRDVSGQVELRIQNQRSKGNFGQAI